MKTLLIDAGNTRVKFGWVDTTTGEREPAALAIGHDSLAQLDAWLRNLAPEITRAIGTNVAASKRNRIHARSTPWQPPRRNGTSARPKLPACAIRTTTRPMCAESLLAMVGMEAPAQGTRS